MPHLKNMESVRIKESQIDRALLNFPPKETERKFVEIWKIFCISSNQNSKMGQYGSVYFCADQNWFWIGTNYNNIDQFSMNRTFRSFHFQVLILHSKITLSRQLIRGRLLIDRTGKFITKVHSSFKQKAFKFRDVPVQPRRGITISVQCVWITAVWDRIETGSLFPCSYYAYFDTPQRNQN